MVRGGRMVEVRNPATPCMCGVWPVRCLTGALLVAIFVQVFASLSAAAEPEAPPEAKLGDRVADFTFKDIRYLERSLADFGEKRAFVLAFTTLECPLVERYLPRLVELEARYRPEGVQFVVVNVGGEDPLREVAHQAMRFEAPFPFVKDFDGLVAQAVGARRTPEVVVLDAERRLRYRGRIDSQYRVSGVQPAAGREDLREALDDVLAGREVAVATTPVDGCLIQAPSPRDLDREVTFHQHIAPLLQQHCQDCHHEGGESPFALVTYEEVAAQADTIGEVVREQRMPPWFASREHGTFTNRRELTAAERRLVRDWIDGGARQGDSALAPPPREFVHTKWKIGEPDLVVQAPSYALPATGYLPYKYALLPYVFTEDTWVQRVQILPSQPATVHHCNMAYVQPGGEYGDANFITGLVPGGDAMELRDGVAFMIPRGSMLVLQIHYVTTGQETKDQISVGFGYAKETIQKRLRHVLVNNTRFQIPPGDPFFRVAAERTLDCDATGVGLFTHMHVRGRDMTYRARYTDGRAETLLAIPNYSFDWQIPYRWAVGERRFPKGTTIEVVAHYDNSTFNPFNPDATATVEEGQQTFQEMMYGFFFYTDDAEQLNLRVDPTTGLALAANK
jgi:thiol-disulfide isomerase/thioredoxin